MYEVFIRLEHFILIILFLKLSIILDFHLFILTNLSILLLLCLREKFFELELIKIENKKVNIQFIFNLYRF